MRKVHYFNPENDLALAAGTKTYTPPAAALQIKNGGEILPLWYASPGDKVLCHNLCPHWLEKVRNDFNIETDLYNREPNFKPSPWGWSPSAKREFLIRGVKSELLPSDDKIEKMRGLSHRRTSIEIYNLVNERLPNIKFAGKPASELKSLSEVESYLKYQKKAYLKTPWSSSGRGVICTSQAGIDKAIKFAYDSIRRQGSILIEEEAEKAIDFAKLFICADGECQPIGTSVFITDKKGAYAGNLLASESEKLKFLGQYTSLYDLQSLTEAMTKIVNEIISPYYNGILGIDMLVDKKGSIHPIVELNLRKTMGYVAHEFSQRYMPIDAKGIFTVFPTKKSNIQSEYTVSNGLLNDGQILLTPSNPFFSFVATIVNDDTRLYQGLLC